MALVTTDDLARAMNTTFLAGSPEEDQAEFVCELVEAVIGEELDMLFTSTTVTDRMQADYDGVIQLSCYPVTEVTTITTLAGATRAGWLFDGIDEISGLEAHEVCDVTYTAGESAPPTVLKKLATAIASRLATNPNGIRQQTVGAISETYAAGSGDAGTFYLTPMERSVLDRYKTTYQTWRLGPRSRLWQTEGVLPTL